MTDNDLYYFLNFPIKIDEHEHPLLLCNCQRQSDINQVNKGWKCDKCLTDYTSCTPSFYCTYCDYDLCSKCLGEYKLNQIKRYNENIMIFNNYNQLNNNNCFAWQRKSPRHIHSLSLIKRINNSNWTCDNCNKTFKKNDKMSFYCSLCDYNLCTQCYMNKNAVNKPCCDDSECSDIDNPPSNFGPRKRPRPWVINRFRPYERENELRKPVIYLYPEKEMDISVQLNINSDSKLTTIYPKFNRENNTWNVYAKPNGDIQLNNKIYPYLFWEAQSYSNLEMNEGFIVNDTNAEEFLENKLKILGLNEKESTDFITYWLPVLLKNKLSLCTFQTEKFFNNFKLNINPKPDTLIRIFLSIKKIDSPMMIKEQKLDKNERKGYTVIEWGGTNICS
jgi:hypothetical protein